MKKKSVKKSAVVYRTLIADLREYVADASSAGLTDQQVTWTFDGAVIRLSAGFERLMLDALVGAVNKDNSHLARTVRVRFPKHLTDEVTEYLITGAGYFDFKGREGLIRQVKQCVPESHYLLNAVKKAAHKEPLERMLALRNYAAHGSRQSKQAATKAVGLSRLSSAGAWLKRQNRFDQLAAKQDSIAAEIEAGAPY